MRALVALSLAVVLAGAGAAAQERPAPFPPAQIQKGAELFARHCATCHGTRMRNPQWGIDLHTFPRDAHERFVDSVTNGKRAMPPWDDVLNRDDIEALWGYIVTGEPEN